MPPLIRLRCQLGSECRYETAPLEYDQANHQVESHMRWAHSRQLVSSCPPEVKRETATPGVFLGISRGQGEAVSQFLTRLRAAAASCDFTVKCPSCQAEVSYSDSLVGHKLVADQQVKEVPDTRDDTEMNNVTKEAEEAAMVDNDELSNNNLPELKITRVESLAPSSPTTESRQDEVVGQVRKKIRISLPRMSHLHTPLGEYPRLEKHATSTPHTVRKRKKREKWMIGGARLDCHVCGVSLKDRSHLYQHYCGTHYKTMLMSNIDSHDLRCTVCGKEFKKVQVLVTHLGSVHDILGRISRYLRDKNQSKSVLL